MPTATVLSATARTVTVPLVVVGLLLASIVPAAAHPFVRGGGEVPVDSLATITLDVAHGCGSEAAGAGAETLEVALEVPEWLRVVEVAAHPGYRHEVEVGDGRIVVVTWLEDGDAEPAPSFDLDVVASGEAGATRHLGVFQACAEQTYRWIGTPDEPADNPAVRVELVAADPDRPAPPEEELEDPAEPEGTEEEPVDDPAPADEDAEEATDVGSADPDATDGAAAATDAATGPGPVLWALFGLAVLAGVAALVLRGRARGGSGADEGRAADDAPGADTGR